MLIWIFGITIFNRIKSSSENRNYFSCQINDYWKIQNCDDRTKIFNVSGNQISFVSSDEWFNAMYIPFDKDEVKLHIDADVKADYEFWVLYDTFGRNELQWVDDEIILDSTENWNKFIKKFDNNFFFEKRENENLLTINTKKQIITQQGIWHLDFMKKSLLVQWKNPKWVIMYMNIPETWKNIQIFKD